MNVAVPIGLAVVLALALRGRGGSSSSPSGARAELDKAQSLFRERKRVYDALMANRGPDDPATVRLRAELTGLAKKIKDLKLLV